VPTRPSDHVRGEWLRRVEAEYRSTAIAQHLGLWLIQIGASPDLIALAIRIASDELAHADLSHQCYVEAGGTDVPALDRATLGLVRHENEPLEIDIARVGVDVFCLGETVAVPLFKTLREGCTVPAARKVLDRVLRDEVRHRDFGWALLSWMLEGPSEASVRALIDRELPRWFSRVRSVYAPPGAGSKTAIAPEDRAWGLMAPAIYGEVLERTYERDWKPRFAKLGIDASGAWAASGSARD
jgi:hypothetical protein